MKRAFIHTQTCKKNWNCALPIESHFQSFGINSNIDPIRLQNHPRKYSQSKSQNASLSRKKGKRIFNESKHASLGLDMNLNMGMSMSMGMGMDLDSNLSLGLNLDLKMRRDVLFQILKRNFSNSSHQFVNRTFSQLNPTSNESSQHALKEGINTENIHQIKISKNTESTEHIGNKENEFNRNNENNEFNKINEFNRNNENYENNESIGNYIGFISKHEFLNQKYVELQSLLQDQYYLEFLKEMLNLSNNGFDIYFTPEQRDTLYVSLFSKINQEALVGLLKYRMDLFLQNIPLFYHLINFIWREGTLELKELVFTKEVEQYLLQHRITSFLRKSNEPLDEIMKRKILFLGKMNHGTQENQNDDLLNILENPIHTHPQSHSQSHSQSQSSITKFSNLSNLSNSLNSSNSSQVLEIGQIKFDDKQIRAAIIEYQQFELKLLHKVLLFYLDDGKYETAYEIMRMNCTPIDRLNRIHRKVWTHFYSNLINFGFMGSLEKSFKYKFRNNPHQVLKANDKKAISKIISQPFSNSSVSLNGLMKDIFYHVIFLEYCALSQNSELAQTFFMNHTLPLLNEKLRILNQSIHHACEERLVTALFKSLFISEDLEKLINFYEKNFADLDKRPCKIYPSTWNFIVLAYAKQGHHGKVKNIINNQIYKETDPKHIDHIIEALLKGLIESGNTKSIYKLFQEMYIGSYGRKPSHLTVSLLIETLLKDENLSYAIKVFEQFYCPSDENQHQDSFNYKLSLRAKPAASIMKVLAEKQNPEAAISFIQSISSKVDWNQCNNVQSIIYVLQSFMKKYPEHTEELAQFITKFKDIQTKNQIEKSET